MMLIFCSFVSISSTVPQIVRLRLGVCDSGSPDDLSIAIWRDLTASIATL